MPGLLRGIRDAMEIARLTAICRKTKCGALDNEIVRLRAQIAALEGALENAERIADLEKQGVEREKKENAKKITDLEKQNADLDSKNADLDSKNNNLFLKNVELELEVNQLESGLARCHYVEHERDYKELDDLNNQERDERMQEDIKQSERIIDLEFENQHLEDVMAYGAGRGLMWRASVMICVQRNRPTSKQSSSTVLS
jgi:hypothetical protein